MAPRKNPRYKTVRVHLGTYERLIRIAHALRAKAARGMEVPVRVDLGIIHMLDAAVAMLEKGIQEAKKGKSANE